MDRFAQGATVKYFWMKGWGTNASAKNLLTDSRGTWFHKNNKDDISFLDDEITNPAHDELGPGSPDSSSAFLSLLSGQCDTASECTDRQEKKSWTENSEWKIPEMMGSTWANDAWKSQRIQGTIRILEILQERENYHYAGIITGEESWRASNICPDSMFAPSRNKVSTRRRTSISFKKVIMTLFYFQSWRDFGLITQETEI
jgi:hypothetical protein